MKEKTDFLVIDGGSVMTLKPLSDRAKLWLSEATEIADIEYTGGPLACDPDIAQEFLASAESADLIIKIL